MNGRAKAGIEGMGYNAGTYRIAWDILPRDFGRPELVVNAQVKRLHSYPLIKPHNPAEVIKYSHIVSSCVNVLNQFSYVSDDVRISFEQCGQEIADRNESQVVDLSAEIEPEFQNHAGFQCLDVGFC